MPYVESFCLVQSDQVVGLLAILDNVAQHVHIIVEQGTLECHLKQLLDGSQSLGPPSLIEAEKKGIVHYRPCVIVRIPVLRDQSRT